MSDIYPSLLQRADLKDLSKGMISTKPTTGLPPGAFLDVKDLYVTMEGLQRRNGWRLFFPTKTSFGRIPMVAGEVMTDIESFFDPTNNLQLLAFTTKRLYVNLTGEEFVCVPFGSVDYEVSSFDTTTVTDSASDFVADAVRVNDYIRFNTEADPLLPPVWSTEAKITLVAQHVLTMAAVPAGVANGQSFQIIRQFDLTDNIVDYAFAPKSVIVVDGSPRGVWRYDGEKLVDMGVHGAVADVTDQYYLKGARSVHFFNGYLMLGNTIENYTDATLDNKLDQKRTLRWSSVTDISEFAIVDYVIFTREMSQITKVTSSEEFPIVYLANGIYYGTPSDLTGLPYKYERVETGAISAVGPRAMTSVPGGQVFVAQKNIYLLQVSQSSVRIPSIVPMGDNIFTKSCYLNASFLFTRAFFLPQQNCLVCTFPKSKKTLGRLFYFSFDTKTWSYVDDETNRFTTANTFPYYNLLRWADGDTTAWSGYDSVTWFSMKLEDYTMRLFVIDTNGYMYVADESYNWDETVSSGTIARVPFSCRVETGDLDFGSVGVNKMLSKIIVTVADVATSVRVTDLTVKVEVSVDRGKSWLDKGTITVESGTFVEDCTLRVTAEVLRLRLTFGANSALFIMSELELRYRILGTFSQRGA